MKTTTIARRLRDAVDTLSFGAPVTHVYNPLRYAWAPHRAYLERYGVESDRVFLIGMNPGPFGMAQTGVPFGEIAAVRDWLGIGGKVGKPPREHPKRPVVGFDCTRAEVSGRRLWGWAEERFGTPDAFHERFFVWNYCPLVFMEESGRNRTPDKLPGAERAALYEVCDRALVDLAEALSPRLIVGIGRFAADRAQQALGADDGDIPAAPHPSPANPAANRGWSPIFELALEAAGVELPSPASRR